MVIRAKGWSVEKAVRNRIVCKVCKIELEKSKERHVKLCEEHELA
jgi:hypothetical protein